MRGEATRLEVGCTSVQQRYSGFAPYPPILSRIGPRVVGHWRMSAASLLGDTKLGPDHIGSCLAVLWPPLVRAVPG